MLRNISVFALLILATQVSNAKANQETEVAGDQETEISTTSQTAGLAFLNKGEAPSSIEQLRLMEKHVANLAEKCKPAVVNIRVGQGQGSGVVVDRYGTVLTAAHVISGPNLDAVITFPDGTKREAKTLGVNKRLDSGMLQITERGRFPYLMTGESKPLELGQWVMAIGHPGGLDEDRGLVVRIGRVLFNDESVLRTDCTLVGGDSGGPLINMDGDVIGIHSRIGGSLTDNLHIPIDGFSREWDQLADGKRVGEKPRPYMGFDLVEQTNEIAELVEDGPAAKAGMKVGDQIIKIGSKKVSDRSGVASRIRRLKPGEKVSVVVKRGDKEETLEVTLGERY